MHELFGTGGVSAVRKFTDADIRDDLGMQAAAVRFLADIQRQIGWLGPDAKVIRTGFTASMVAQSAIAGRSLTVPQMRGVANVMAGALYANRRRFWKSRPSRKDRNDGDEACIVCGGPLTDEVAVRRGAGATCYLRLMESAIG